MIVESVLSELETYANPVRKEHNAYFFKTGKGEYAEGDQFVGVSVPDVRKVIANHLDASLADIEELLQSPLHEVRLAGLFILVGQMEQTEKRSWSKTHTLKETQDTRQKIYEFYLDHTAAVNNWDLVDGSAPHIVGSYLIDKDRKPLYHLAHSKNLWEQRIAIVSTYAFIRKGDTADTYAIATLLLHHSHDLLHKAVGWMLREAGKRDLAGLTFFLDQHAAEMPRTILRYSIEKLSADKRKHYMNL